MSQLPWYQELFSDEYLRLWAPSITAELTEREVQGIVDLLQLPSGSRVLDLCCGHGRHAVPLALRGYRVTGQDLSEVFLERARSEGAACGADVRWVHGDMREIPFVEEFDSVLNLFTAFGYFETDEEDLRVLRQVVRALIPGGRFLLEIKHQESIVRKWLPTSVTRHPDGLIATEERRFDFLSGRAETLLTAIEPDGRRREYRYSVRSYTVAELAAMFRAAGLTVEAVYGGLDGSALTLESPRLALVGRK